MADSPAGVVPAEAGVARLAVPPVEPGKTAAAVHVVTLSRERTSEMIRQIHEQNEKPRKNLLFTSKVQFPFTQGSVEHTSKLRQCEPLQKQKSFVQIFHPLKTCRTSRLEPALPEPAGAATAELGVSEVDADT